jgi:uncharacterized protein (DUF1499 family)
MTVVKWILIALAVLVVGALLAGQFGLLGGKPPADLGVRDGKLKRPSSTNNSVSSQAGLWPDHPQRERARIDPLPLRGDGAATIAGIASVVKAMPGAVIVEQRPDYLYAQYTTRLMKYVDDVEFWVDPAAGVVQVRSASRLGAEDMGVNRARIEAVRAALAAAK